MTENENAVKDYLDYLRKYSKKHRIGVWQAHQHVVCRSVAREYGLSEEQINQLDEDL